MTFRDVHKETPDEKRVSIVNHGDHAVLAIGTPTPDGNGHHWPEEAKIEDLGRNDLMIIIANLSDVAYALPWEDA